MKEKCFRLLIVCAIFLLLFGNLTTTVFAAQTYLNTDEWQFAAFGSNTSEEKNPPPVFHEDGSFSIDAAGGKIASSEEGLSYYFKEISVQSNFEFHTRVKVDRYNPDSQRSFGLMIRDQVEGNGDSGKAASNYLAVGGLDDKMRGFYNQDGLTKMDSFSDSNPPVTGEVYDLSIKKSGEAYEVAVNGEQQVVTLTESFSDNLYVGFYVAREAAVTFDDFSVEVIKPEPDKLLLDAENMKKDYLIGEKLELEGLQVTAVYPDGSTQLLDTEQYFVTGFDSMEAGDNQITFHYGGASAVLDLTIRELVLTDLRVKYYPAKLDYHLDDSFEADGLVVEGEYDNGYLVKELDEEMLRFVINGEDIDSSDYRFTEPGVKTVTVQSKQEPSITSSFDVSVSNAALTGLEIEQLPEKTTYYPGDELDLAGLIVNATYSDGTTERVMLQQLTASDIDDEVIGEQQVKLFYKHAETAFSVKVQENGVRGLKLVNYPKTTYHIGEDFDSSGIQVGKFYANKNVELIDESDYEIDISRFDKERVGVYTVEIIPSIADIEPVTFEVTVRETSEPEWKVTQFGQSTGAEKNYIEPLSDGGIRLVAEPGAGKITGDHDGITFYYTELDAEADNFRISADIKVNEYAKSPAHDGQESFGIMARDAIGEEDDSSVFASNIAAIGGFSGGTQEENGTQLFIRTGVETPDGAGSNGIMKNMLKAEKPGLENTYPENDYRLTLSKTNSGFTGQLNDGEQAIFFEPEILNVQDAKMYLGFYAARLADIEVHNLEFESTAQATDPPKVVPPHEPIEPELNVLSRTTASETDYELLVQPNVDGFVTIRQGMDTIVRYQPIQAEETSVFSTELEASADNDFSISFIPDDTQDLTNYNKIIRNYTVTMKTYRNGQDIHVSPDGNNLGNGTKDNPLDLDTAIAYVQPGQKIILADGTYKRKERLLIEKFNDGTKEKRKYLMAEEGASPVIDFDKKSEGVVLSGDYWHVTGIDFTGSAGNTKGFTVGGSHNTIENSRFYGNGDTGLQISRTSPDSAREDWPSHNLILNSESFDNRDPSENNADGFAAKLTAGENNVFRGCIAHHNIDDGWDLYTKAGTGAIGSVLIEDSIAYQNGTLTDGTVGDGDKNGFKLGGEGIHVPHVIKDSIAFSNGAAGFTSNSNPGVIAVNNVSYDNAGGNIDFSTYSTIEPDFTIDGFVSYQTQYNVRDSLPSELVSESNFFFNGDSSENSNGVQLTDASFVSLEPALPYQRDGEGNIIKGGFLQVLLPAAVTIDPSVIKKRQGQENKSSKQGAKLNVFIELNRAINPEDIEEKTVRLDGDLQPVSGKSAKIVDHDNDGTQELKLQFSKSELERKLEKGDQMITLNGELVYGLPFQGKVEVLVK
ncbi:bacterial Ig-like domain-containing protein [Virgibacillus senegalensis]|uniref:bacterial Ig-like domain-containing protein n=1 Tax=Virgibacillus senegalensis TaxID=1499679 RepID=UPI00069E23CF|nr:bacterial Ig-like domain-containing protein [Virgibacillus senegalensis]